LLMSNPTIYAVGIAFVVSMVVSFLLQITMYVLEAFGMKETFSSHSK
jgi:hypothetical protein